MAAILLMALAEMSVHRTLKYSEVRSCDLVRILHPVVHTHKSAFSSNPRFIDIMVTSAALVGYMLAVSDIEWLRFLWRLLGLRGFAYYLGPEGHERTRLAWREVSWYNCVVIPLSAISFPLWPNSRREE